MISTDLVGAVSDVFSQARPSGLENPYRATEKTRGRQDQIAWPPAMEQVDYNPSRPLGCGVDAIVA